ncbi:hypothetical protein, partial [Tsukamurella sp. MT6.1]
AGLGNYSLPIDSLHESDEKFAMLFNDMAVDWNGAQNLAARTNASFKEKSALGEQLLKEGAKK